MLVRLLAEMKNNQAEVLARPRDHSRNEGMAKRDGLSRSDRGLSGE
jgi:hypothetical protein